VKTVERWLLKIIIIQFIFLLLTQLFFHELEVLPELNQLTQYEGVNENKFTEYLETISE
jgi:hypothetical protein